MNRYLFQVALLLLATAGWCGYVGCVDKTRCDIDVSSYLEWDSLNGYVIMCKLGCDDLQTIQVTVKNDIEFLENAPDENCSTNFNSFKFTYSFVLKGEGQPTISNVCMYNLINNESYGFFYTAEHQLSISNLKFKNIYADANQAKYFGLFVGKVDGDVQISNVELENVRVKVDSASHFSGGILGAVVAPEKGPERGKVTISNLRIKDLVVESRSKLAVGGVLGYVQDSLTMMMSNISLAMKQDSIEGVVDANSAFYGGVVGYAANTVQLFIDSIDVNMDINADFDRNVQTVGIGGAAGKVDAGGLLATQTWVKANIKTNARSTATTDRFFSTAFYMGGLVGQWKAVSSDSFWVNSSEINADISAKGLLVPFVDVGGILGNAFVENNTGTSLVAVMDVKQNTQIDLESNYFQRAYAGGLIGDFYNDAGNFSVLIESTTAESDIRGITFSGAAGGLVGFLDAQTVLINETEASGKVRLQMHDMLYDYRSPLYVGGLVGHSENAKMKVKGASYSGLLQLEEHVATVDTATDWKAGGLFGYVSKGFLSLDSSNFAGNLMLYKVPGTLAVGGLIGGTQELDSLAVTRSYATGVQDTLVEVHFQPLDTGSFGIGGLIGINDKVRVTRITNDFVRGSIVLRDTLLSTLQDYVNVAGIVARDMPKDKSASILIQDVYYRGGFVMDDLYAKRRPLAYGLAVTDNKNGSINAAYAIDFTGVAMDGSNLKKKELEVVATAPSDTLVLQTHGKKEMVILNTQDFNDLLNEAAEREPAWVWSDSVNDGLPWLLGLENYDVVHGSIERIEFVEEDEEEDSTEIEIGTLPEKKLACDYIGVYASGNIAKVDVNFRVESSVPALMRVQLVKESEKVVSDSILVVTSTDSVMNFIYKGLKTGDYHIVVMLDTLSVQTSTWNVRNEIELKPNAWTMAALGSADLKAFSNAGDFTVFRWDERGVACDYWQYVVQPVDEKFKAEEGYWIYSKSAATIPAKDDEPAVDSLHWQLHSEFYGWNMVANPYPWDIALDSVADFQNADDSKTPYWMWDTERRTYVPADKLPAYGAFWVNVSEETVRSVSTEPKFTEQPVATYGKRPEKDHALAKTARGTSGSSWSLRLMLKGTDGSEDSWNVVGVGARNVGVAEPPEGMERGVSLNILGGNDAGAKGVKRLSKSIYAESGVPSGGSVSWTLAVSSAKLQSATLEVDGLEELDALGLMATIEYKGQSIPCRAGVPVVLELSTTASQAELKVAPKSAAVTVAKSLENVRFVKMPAALNVSFGVSESLVGAAADVMLLDLSGRTLAATSLESVSRTNNVSLAMPERGGVCMLVIRAGNERKSLRIRL